MWCSNFQLKLEKADQKFLSWKIFKLTKIKFMTKIRSHEPKFINIRFEVTS